MNICCCAENRSRLNQGSLPGSLRLCLVAELSNDTKSLLKKCSCSGRLKEEIHRGLVLCCSRLKYSDRLHQIVTEGKQTSLVTEAQLIMPWVFKFSLGIHSPAYQMTVDRRRQCTFSACNTEPFCAVDWKQNKRDVLCYSHPDLDLRTSWLACNVGLWIGKKNNFPWKLWNIWSTKLYFEPSNPLAPGLHFRALLTKKSSFW